MTTLKLFWDVLYNLEKQYKKAIGIKLWKIRFLHEIGRGFTYLSSHFDIYMQMSERETKFMWIDSFARVLRQGPDYV